MFSKTLLSVVAGATAAAAHGFVTDININGVEYPGFDINTAPYQPTPPVVVGWSDTATDLGFVAPSSFGSPDIICHRDAENAKGHAQVAAGSSLVLQWNTWPDSHKGPVLNYLAACSDAGCEAVDKTSLEFFKIGEKGYSGTTWASDELLANNGAWLVNIPASIAPGFYVLRHEIIALHSAGQPDGAQNYPQCVNIEVTGSGTDVPTGVAGTALYKPDDAGILFDLYNGFTSYPIPGPSMYSGASEPATQSSSAVTATGTATTGTALATGAPPAVSTPAATTAVTSGLVNNAASSVAPTPTTSATAVASAPAVTEAPTATDSGCTPRVTVITITV